jgi:CRISP-associated protein Cas1
MLKGRLGLETARVPHADRHGCLWLRRGVLSVEDGTLRFRTAGSLDLTPGDHGIPFQTISVIFLEPGSAVTHDALRCSHGTEPRSSQQVKKAGSTDGTDLSRCTR